MTVANAPGARQRFSTQHRTDTLLRYADRPDPSGDFILRDYVPIFRCRSTDFVAFTITTVVPEFYAHYRISDGNPDPLQNFGTTGVPTLRSGVWHTLEMYKPGVTVGMSNAALREVLKGWSFVVREDLERVNQNAPIELAWSYGTEKYRQRASDYTADL